MERYDLFIIGGGGTGSEIAGRLGSRGDMKIAMAERDKLGGECNNYGCVPTKVMLRSAKIAALARDAGRFGIDVGSVEVDFPAVMKRVRTIVDHATRHGATPYENMGVRVLMDGVRIVGPNRLETASGEQIEAARIVMASGTDAAAPPIPGLADGPYWTNVEAIWSPTEVPQRLAVIGSGPIGIEFAQVYARFGAQVTILEVVDRIVPIEDADSSAALATALQEEGIRLLTGVKITRAEHSGKGWRLDIEGQPSLEADEVLVATGRKPRFDGHDLDAVGLRLDDKGKPVLDDHLRSTAPGIWVAGDATGDLLFTHVGTYEADIVIRDVLGDPEKRDYRVVPKVTYCDPEVASVGLTEAAAHDAGHAVVTSMMKFTDNERAGIEGREHGHVKLVADAKTKELLGGHIVGEGAGDMIHEIVAAMAARVPARTMANAIHSYPTMSESIRSAFWELADSLGE